jgi:hypothetical protein
MYFFIRLVLMLLLDLSARPAWALDTYYVFDGAALTTIHDDPNRITVDQWAAFYYVRDAPKDTLSGRWGASFGSSPEEVLEDVASNQKFERRYAKWCGCGENNKYTYSNELAPVATLKKAFALNPMYAEMLDRVHADWDRVKGLAHRFNRAADLAGETKLPTLSTFLKGPLKDFMTAIHNSVDLAMSINAEIVPFSNRAMSNLEDKLRTFSDNVGRAEETVEGALRTFPPTLAAVDNTQVTFQIGERKSVSVRVVDGAGNPIAGAKVAWATPSVSSKVYIAETNVEGIVTAANMISCKQPCAFTQTVAIVDHRTKTGLAEAADVRPLSDAVVFRYVQTAPEPTSVETPREPSTNVWQPRIEIIR